MAGELSQDTTDAKEHEGEHFLSLLGLGHLAGEIVLIGGAPKPARDFLDDEKCALFARPALRGLEAMDPDDPGRKSAIQDLRGVVEQLMQPASEA